MYAVVDNGGKQYRVAAGDIIRIERADGNPGEEIVLENVLLLQTGEKISVGRPFLKDVRVRAEILAQGKGKKVTIFKFKRRKGHRKKQGHRQGYTGIRINAIETVATAPGSQTET